MHFGALGRVGSLAFFTSWQRRSQDGLTVVPATSTDKLQYYAYCHEYEVQ